MGQSRPASYSLMLAHEREEFDSLIAAVEDCCFVRRRDATDAALRASCDLRLKRIAARMTELQELAVVRAPRIWKLRDPSLPEWLG